MVYTNNDNNTDIFQKLFNHDILSSEEELELIEKAQAGDEDAKNRIIECNQRLIASIAHKYANVSQSIDLEDLIFEANFGLIKAIEKFDVTTGNKFSTYAVFWISQVITRYIENTGSIIRVPVRRHAKIFALKKFKRDFEASHNDNEPSEDDIIVALDLENVIPRVDLTGKKLTKKERRKKMSDYIKDLELDLDMLSSQASIHALVGEDEDCELIDLISDDKGADPIDNVKNKEFFEWLCREVDDWLLTTNVYRKKKLGERNKDIVFSRLGISYVDGSECEIPTLQALGDKYKISKERIRQVEDSFIRFERTPKRMRKTREYFDIPVRKQVKRTT